MNAFVRGLAVVALSAILPIPTPLAAAPAREAEPTLPTAALVGNRVPLRGTGYRLAPQTRIEDYTGRFRIDADIGRIDAAGLDELDIRVRELPAARRLLAMERSDAFKGALVNAAKDTGRALANVVERPVETVAALPKGIGRAIVSAARRVRNVAVGIGDAAKRESDERNDAPAAPRGGGDRAVDFAAELVGVNKARRGIAKAVGIDPYTDNPLIADKLGELAWASVAGGLSMDLVLSSIPDGVRDSLGTAGQINDLAWELPPADIRRDLERRLVARGHEGMAAREFLRNGAFSPTDQLAFVGLIERLNLRRGEGAVLETATALDRRGEARFMIRQLRMLAAEQASSRALARYGTEAGVVWGVTRQGAAVLPLAVDHFSWSGEIADGLEQAGRPSGSGHRVLVAGSVSSQARDNAASLGWTTVAGAPLAR